MAVYNGHIQPTPSILSSKRNTTSSKGDIIKYLTPLRGTIKRIRMGINTKDFHVVLFKRIPRERVLNKYSNKNLKL